MLVRYTIFTLLQREMRVGGGKNLVCTHTEQRFQV